MHRQLSPIGEINPHQWEHIKRRQSIPIREINPSQWEHIKHRKLIPIGEVGIYKNATHKSSENKSSGTHHASPVNPHRRVLTKPCSSGFAREEAFELAANRYLCLHAVRYDTMKVVRACLQPVEG
eukprot:Em0003g1749a